MQKLNKILKELSINELKNELARRGDTQQKCTECKHFGIYFSIYRGDNGLGEDKMYFSCDKDDTRSVTAHNYESIINAKEIKEINKLAIDCKDYKDAGDI